MRDALVVIKIEQRVIESQHNVDIGKGRRADQVANIPTPSGAIRKREFSASNAAIG